MKREILVEKLTKVVDSLEQISLRAKFFISPTEELVGPVALIYMLGAIPETHNVCVTWLSKKYREDFLFFQETGLGVITAWARK